MCCSLLKKSTKLTVCSASEPEEPIFMVIGGYVGRGSDDVEELRMNSSVQNDCPVPERFPVIIYGAVGANMGKNK